MKCARCHHEVRHPIMLAGMPLGRKCFVAVRTALHEREHFQAVAIEHAPLFLPLFDTKDLLGDRVE